MNPVVKNAIEAMKPKTAMNLSYRDSVGKVLLGSFGSEKGAKKRLAKAQSITFEKLILEMARGKDPEAVLGINDSDYRYVALEAMAEALNVPKKMIWDLDDAGRATPAWFKKWRNYLHLVGLVNPADKNAPTANAGVKTVKVTLETVTFDQGVKAETRHMSIPELKTLLKMLGRGSDADAFVQQLDDNGASDIAIASPDLYAMKI